MDAVILAPSIVSTGIGGIIPFTISEGTGPHTVTLDPGLGTIGPLNYDPVPDEQSIVYALYDFALANRNVDSIYIGYEDTGAFVRTGPIQETHPAGEEFNYDPRVRSWYTNAVSAPNEFVYPLTI